MSASPDTQLCPHCGRQTPAVRRCVHCGGALARPAPAGLMSSTMPGADYGVYLIALPVIAVVGLLIVALAAHSLAGWGWLLALTALLSGLLVAAEIFQAPAAWTSGSALKPLTVWSGAVLLLWPVGYPLYLRARQRYGLSNWLIAALAADAVFIAGALFALWLTFSDYGKAPLVAKPNAETAGLLTADPRWVPDPDAIEIVKSGHLDNCPSKTLEQEVNGFFEAPRWQAGAATGGADFVNVSGLIDYQGKTAVATFQFVLYKDKSGFRYQAFTINGVPQPLYVAGLTLAQMCG